MTNGAVPSTKWSRGRERMRRFARSALEAFNRIRLPGPSVLPVAGAVVGVYGGLAAGLFSSMIGIVSGLVFGLPKILGLFHRHSAPFTELSQSFHRANWHTEYAIVGVPLALGALLLARLMSPGGPRDVVKRRLRVLALLTLGALGLYYPLVALTVVNQVFGHLHELVHALDQLPFWAYLLAPTIGGALVGRMLQHRPETHGHGVPEVVLAAKRNLPLRARNGLLKLVASAVTIGSGGSAGREGPIVYGGAALAAAAGRTLGFSRKELSTLLAAGAGAGLAASFNAPIGGAIFALEIILREFELKVFSPIILASVTATMVGRGVMGTTPLLGRFEYEMKSGWEIVAYVALGLLCGVISYVYVTALHEVEHFYHGKYPGKLSRFLSRKSDSFRAASGGLIVGLMAAVNPAVWGTAHEFINLAWANQLTITFLAVACVFKLAGTALSLGSGGSGGTFFPATVIGAMGGGAFGALVHHVFPTLTATSGAYSMVGVGGAIAGLTRGPLTGMMMVYELSGNYKVILPLMVTCTISSALTHYLVERKAPKPAEADVLHNVQVRALMLSSTPVTAGTPIRSLVDLVLGAETGALSVLDGHGSLYGIVHFEDLREVWRDEQLGQVLVASDVARKVTIMAPESDLSSALDAMDHDDVDALPVLDSNDEKAPYSIVTRSQIRRFVVQQQAQPPEEPPVGATEVLEKEALV